MSETTTRTVSMQIHPALTAYLEWLDLSGDQWSDDTYVTFRANWEQQYGVWVTADDCDDEVPE